MFAYGQTAANAIAGMNYWRTDPGRGSARMKIEFLALDCFARVCAQARMLILIGATAGITLNISPANAGTGTGQQVYEQHCAACHGLRGEGDGPASVWLFPRPRDFAAGFFKIKTTPGTALPTDDDLFVTVTRGMPGSSMPGFTYLNDQQRHEVVQYVKQLTAYTNASGERINRFEEAKRNGDLAPPMRVPAEPPVTVQSIAEGTALFSRLGCIVCHGETGAGDGPNAPSLRDTKGLYLPPRDFNSGAFRGGSTGRDLFLRIAIGLPGTPMVSYDSNLVTDAERWSLVHYIQSLRRKDVEINDILAAPDNNIHAPKARKLPTDPADPFWESMDPVRIHVNPLWPEKELIYAVAVRAVHDGKRLAILCQWRDPIVNGGAVRVQDFQDAVAMQFSMNGSTPFLGMGDAKNPVNIWQWKAGWQQEAEGERQDVNTVYASIHVDIYLQTNALYRTALAAGNVMSQPHKSPIEDANARGFGTMTSQPMKGQNVQGKGIWRDGHWNVVFVRDLKSRDEDDVKFTFDKAVPVALAIWDGENRDRNGRKVISNWYKLTLD
jgi:mono/diheme cytochrome c family protein